MAQDFKETIRPPAWLRRPESLPQASHQVTLLVRAIGGVLNGVLTAVYNIRRIWLVSQSSGAVLDEHGLDRAVPRRLGEADADYRPRVLAALRAKTPGETKAGMTTALDTLGLVNFNIFELYTLGADNTADPRWDEFYIRFPAAGNEDLTDAEVQARIDAAKPPRAKGSPVRYLGATVNGFGRSFGQVFGS